MKKQFLVITLLTLCLTAYAEEPQKDLDYKADFIVSLMEKTKWPAGKSDSGTFVISVLGQAPILASLEKAAKSSGGKVTVRTVSLQDDLSGDNLLFIPSNDLKILAKALRKVDGKHVLTVSDQKDFARYGVMMGFFKEDGSSDVKYHVNKMAIKFSGMKLDPSIMKNAVII